MGDGQKGPNEDAQMVESRAIRLSNNSLSDSFFWISENSTTAGGVVVPIGALGLSFRYSYIDENYGHRSRKCQCTYKVSVK